MPRIIDHDQRRREIIDVALELIVEGGFDAATMRSIAARAGFANGALKRYFASKEEMVVATFDSILAEMAKRISAEELRSDPVEDLRAYILAPMPLDDYRIRGARVLLALWEYSQVNRDLQARYLAHLQMWREQLEVRIRRALGDDVPADSVDGLEHEVVTMTIGANIACLLLPQDVIEKRYRGYVDRLMTRIAGDAASRKPPTRRPARRSPKRSAATT